MKAHALWYVGPGRAELREEEIAAPGPGEVLVRAVHGSLSRGTESLVFGGRVPESEHERMRGPHMGGAFPFPVKYGYAVVGRIEAGPDHLRDRMVFALYPHQDVFVLPADAVKLVPATVPAQRAVLAANMETALNAVWDGAPGPADRIAIVGAGVVGVLVAYLCARLPGAEVTLVDIDPARERIAQALGVRFALSTDAPTECDVVFHASGRGAGLATALSLAGDEGTIVEMTWYGTSEVTVPLGGPFHSRRLTLRSSQVGKVAPSHRSRWPLGRRLAAALEMLADARLDVLFAPAITFASMPSRLPAILASGSGVLCQRIDYPDAEGGG
jgi:NADPH:quinone reductase-like Zn-dependent oxidoreductase